MTALAKLSRQKSTELSVAITVFFILGFSIAEKIQ